MKMKNVKLGLVNHVARWGYLLLAGFAVMLSVGCQPQQLSHPPQHPGWVDNSISCEGDSKRLAVAEGYLCVGSGEGIFVFDHQTGKPVWQNTNLTRTSYFDDRKSKGSLEPGKWNDPWISAIGIAGGKLFAAETFTDTVLVFDLKTGGEPRRFKLPNIYEITPSADGKEAFLASNSNQWYRINGETLEVSRIKFPAGGRGINAILAHPNGRTVYVAICRGTKLAGAKAPSKAAGPINPLDQFYSGPFLAEYDLVENRYTHLMSIGDTLKARGDDCSSATSISLSADAKTLYITLWQCYVGIHVYDTQDHCLLKPATIVKDPSAPSDENWSTCWQSAQVGDSLYFVANHRPVQLYRKSLSTGKITPLPYKKIYKKAFCHNNPWIYIATKEKIIRVPVK